LSEQDLVSCDKKDGNAGCKGGWPYRAIDFVHQQGIDTELSYPYVSGRGSVPTCAASLGRKADIQVVQHTVIESDELTMAAWVAKNGPLSVVVDAMTQLWWHLLSASARTMDRGTYWLIENSWNEQWGEQGYIRLQRGTNQCGIIYQPVGAVVGGSPPSPPSPPTPSSSCPSDAELVSTAHGKECRWVNGTRGVGMPPKPLEYCDYIGDGYFGYFWGKAQGSYDCPASAQRSATSDSYFCVWTDGKKGVKIPMGSAADCSRVAQGQMGFVMPGGGGGGLLVV
jgi:hypothetical protein